ncbi:MAG: DEAD/DEAH box helicase [Saprospiraceae bacterium]
MIYPFKELGLLEPICTALQAIGFEEPTEVQKRTIPYLLSREGDLLALAQTGTGKTAAFGLPILQNINSEDNHTQALIISPTRELCLQIATDLKSYSRNLRKVRIVPVYGGSSITVQIKELKIGAHIIVATPGRLIDLMDRKVIRLQNISTVVLDEADEMLNMGFRDDMEAILAKTPEEKLTALFSATMSSDIRKIASTYLHSPEEVTIGKKNAAQQNISHQYAAVHAKDKYTALKRIIDFHEDFYGIVFCSTKIETQEISDHLVRDGYAADCLHGDLAQAQRDKVMHRFRHKAVKLLLATDVAARGIDVKNLTHIIHYHLPDDIENYTHRSGRTARAGQKGISIALLHSREAYKLHQIEKLINIKFERYLIPKGDDILQSRVKRIIDNFVGLSIEDQTEFSNELVWPIMKLTKEEIVNRFLASELKKLNLGQGESPDINLDEKSRERDSGPLKGAGRHQGRSGSNSSSHVSGKSVRLFINLGKKDEIKYDELREIIFKSTKVSGRSVRDIEMKGVYSFFMADSKSAEIMCKVKGATFKGRPIRIQLASDRN